MCVYCAGVACGQSDVSSLPSRFAAIGDPILVQQPPESVAPFGGQPVEQEQPEQAVRLGRVDVPFAVLPPAQDRVEGGNGVPDGQFARHAVGSLRRQGFAQEVGDDLVNRLVNDRGASAACQCHLDIRELEDMLEERAADAPGAARRHGILRQSVVLARGDEQEPSVVPGCFEGGRPWR